LRAKSTACLYCQSDPAWETSDFTLSEHLQAIESRRKNAIDYVVANRKTVSRKVARHYRAKGAVPVKLDAENSPK
jgi:hypothetical protein